MRTINRPKSFNCLTRDLASGESDDIYWFSVDKNLTDGIVVLSVNHLMGYAGVEYYIKDGESDSNWCLENEIFFQNGEDFRDMRLQKDFFDYAPINQAKRLFGYIV